MSTELKIQIAAFDRAGVGVEKYIEVNTHNNSAVVNINIHFFHILEQSVVVLFAIYYASIVWVVALIHCHYEVIKPLIKPLLNYFCYVPTITFLTQVFFTMFTIHCLIDDPELALMTQTLRCLPDALPSVVSYILAEMHLL